MDAFTRRILLLLALVATAVPAAAQNVSAGQTLYNNICRACHGFPPLGGPERAANNPALISTALLTVPQMQPFNFLSSTQIQDIAAYLGSIVAPPPPSTKPTVDYTDLWWNEAESGWGLNLIQHASDIVFGVMYTYESAGRPAWFVLPSGEWTTAFSYTGDFYRVTGPSAEGAFDATKVQAVKVGTATITFSDANHGTYRFSVNGVTVTKSITRQPF